MSDCFSWKKKDERIGEKMGTTLFLGFVPHPGSSTWMEKALSEGMLIRLLAQHLVALELAGTTRGRQRHDG